MKTLDKAHPSFGQRLTDELRPKRLLPGLVAGLVVGVMNIPIEISFAALIFSGSLAGFVPQGIGFILFGTIVILLISSFASSFPGMVALPQDNPAVILGLVSAAIVARLPAGASLETVFVTVMTAIMVSSVFTGLVLWLVGTFKLGKLIRYIPYPVIGGFLAGTGWFLTAGAFGVMADSNLAISTLPALFQPASLLRWLPGLVFAVALLLILRRYSHFLIVPGMIFGSIALFHLALAVSGKTVADAIAAGLLFPPFVQGGLWQPIAPAALSGVDWGAIWSQMGNIASIAVISAISLLLNSSGLEVATHRDLDLNRELQVAGVANLVAGLGGSSPGYATVSLSMMSARIGASSRLVAVAAAALAAITMFFGSAFLSYFPKPVLGGLLLFLGLAFLVEWLYDAWFKLPKAEYLILVLILVAMVNLGVLQGVLVGTVLAVVLFVVEYSRINVARHILSGRTCRSNVDRPNAHAHLLRENGDLIYVLELQGYIFFGTATSLFETIQRRVEAADMPRPRFMLLDFRNVNGLDASAVLSFAKIKTLAKERNITLVFTHLRPSIRRQLEKEILTRGDEHLWQTFPDLDHGLEWCEEEILRALLPPDQRDVSGNMMAQLMAMAPESSSAAAAEQTPRFDSLALVLEQYLEYADFSPGDRLIRQGELPPGIYFLDSGQVTVLLEQPAREPLRLRRAGSGTVLGEIGFYLGVPASASVVADQPTRAALLSARNLQIMERQHPQAALACHKWIAHVLSEKLLSATNSLSAMRD